MKTTQITPFFHLLFLLYLLVTVNSFSNSLLWSILVCKIPQLFAKSYWFGQLIILFQNVGTLRLLKVYIVLFTRWSKIPIFFRLQLMECIGGWPVISSAYYCILFMIGHSWSPKITNFWDSKEALSFTKT